MARPKKAKLPVLDTETSVFVLEQEYKRLSEEFDDLDLARREVARRKREIFDMIQRKQVASQYQY
jgi:hypothetical protein